MNVREKLVELLKTNACPSPFICDQACKYYGYGDCFPYLFADHLISNGVTVQEWISVKDRLPDVGKLVLIYSEINGVCMDYHDGATFGYYGVTHWMPLPNPPKGE